MDKSMNASQMIVTISLAWWILPYLNVVATMCRWMGTEPNWERVAYWVGKSVRIKVAK